jgi:hypothetical protein
MHETLFGIAPEAVLRGVFLREHGEHRFRISNTKVRCSPPPVLAIRGPTNPLVVAIAPMPARDTYRPAHELAYLLAQLQRLGIDRIQAAFSALTAKFGTREVFRQIAH